MFTSPRFFSKCGGCHKRRIFVAKRGVRTPIGKIATSQSRLCNKCIRAIKSVI